jgi:hypothetical protein
MEQVTQEDAYKYNHVYRDFSHNSEGMWEDKPVEYTTEILRKCYWGSIELFLLKNNTIYCEINEIHQNEYIDYGATQGLLIVTYPDNIPIYNVIKIILDKITEDHRYRLQGIRHKDFIVCSDSFVEQHQELCKYNKRENYLGAKWMEFTQENIKYIDVLEHHFEWMSNNDIVLYGEIDTSGNFTYDYPIIGRTMDKDYYDITRGNYVMAVDWDETQTNYFIVSSNDEASQDQDPHPHIKI